MGKKALSLHHATNGKPVYIAFSRDPSVIPPDINCPEAFQEEGKRLAKLLYHYVPSSTIQGMIDYLKEQGY